MKLNKFKRILANILILMFIIPSLSINAESIDINNEGQWGENIAINDTEVNDTEVNDTEVNDIEEIIDEGDLGNLLEENDNSERENEEDVLSETRENRQATYSQNAMARIVKYINGNPYLGTDKNINIYSDSNLTNCVTYINHAKINDAPILADAGSSAKILVSGYEGWINKDSNSSEFDMIVVPVEQVTNPSYYYVQSGELKHYISRDLTGSGGDSIVIGKSPTYLSENIKYFSYDGIYFYDGSNIQNGLNTLINDYKIGSRGNSINSNNPYYTYYNYLPFRSKTIYTADELNRFINENTDKNSKLRGIGYALKDAEQKYGVNALLTLAVAINESGWGMSTIAQTKNNLFGINATDFNTEGSADAFKEPGDSILEFCKNKISTQYSDQTNFRYNGSFLGNKNNGVNVRYASDPYWGEKAAQQAYKIDKYLSGSINNLRDTNVYQIAMTTSNNKVMNSNGTLLYNILTAKSTYNAYVETPFVITGVKKNIAGENCYEIYPERNTPVFNGVTNGEYDWFDRGFIIDKDIKLLNQARGVQAVQPLLYTKGGKTRYETAVEISKSEFTSADTIVLVNGYAIVDGLSSTPVASYYNSPLLLTEIDTLGVATKNEIKRLNAKNVIIVGGTGVVSVKVENELKNMGIYNITRLGGKTRYDTALEVAKYIDGNLYDVNKVVIASGIGEADALTIAPVAGKERMPIILVENNNIPSTVDAWLKDEQLEDAYIIGGVGVVSDRVMVRMNEITVKNISLNRLGGKNRYETNALVIDRFYSEELDTVFIAKGIDLVDALSAGPVAAMNNYPIVLVGNDLTAEQKQVLGKRTAKRIFQAGYGVSQTAINTLTKHLEFYQ